MFEQSIRRAFTVVTLAFGLLTISIGLFAALPFVANAAVGDIDDLRVGVRDFMDRKNWYFQLDDDDMRLLWDAYCGELDPKIYEDNQAAALLGQQLQQKEAYYLDQLQEDVVSWLSVADRLKNSSYNPDEVTRKEADGVYSDLRKVQDNLAKVRNGAVLQGSNHPFVQFAQKYGINMHEKYCDEFAGEVLNLCDSEGWPGIGNLRPDLVTMESGRLVVYEFKPDNDKAMREGRKQLAGYVPAVKEYYQDLFLNGPGEYVVPGDIDKHGGEAVLKALADPQAWGGNGLIVDPKLETYSMCDGKNPYDF